MKEKQRVRGLCVASLELALLGGHPLGEVWLPAPHPTGLLSHH